VASRSFPRSRRRKLRAHPELNPISIRSPSIQTPAPARQGQSLWNYECDSACRTTRVVQYGKEVDLNDAAVRPTLLQRVSFGTDAPREGGSQVLIGSRMALGGQRSDVLRLVLGEGTRMAALGVGIGIAVSMAITRLMSTLLFGISATDPLTFVGVAVLFSLVALRASYIPARRAMRVDPIVALRYE
jgi:hypothetical protein